MNPCTFSYSYAFWDQKRWAAHIKWMALNGINLALAFTGIEYIWIKTFQHFNLTQNEILEYFSGPGYLAWNRMGNLKYLGNLDDHGVDWPILWDWFMSNQPKLQKYILAQMESYGIQAVFPGFAGHVPYEPFVKRFPMANISITSVWGHLNHTYTPVGYLDPRDPLYNEINQIYLEILRREYGYIYKNHRVSYYLIDPFNEIQKQFSNSDDVKGLAQAIDLSLQLFDPLSVWVIQSWTFYDTNTWKPGYIKAFLQGIPKGNLIVLDLAGDMLPLHLVTNNFYGHNFVWCVLHNFGGTSGMQGDMFDIYKKYSFLASKGPPNFVGVGLTMEGILQNDVIYEFVNDLSWLLDTDHFDIKDWIKDYSVRRYGLLSPELTDIWLTLLNTVYSEQNGDSKNIFKTPIELGNFGFSYKSKHPFPGHGQYVITSMPSLSLIPDSYRYNESIIYNSCMVFTETFKTYCNIVRDRSTFMYDFSDVCRQYLQITFNKLYNQIIDAYEERNIPKLDTLELKMREIMTSLEYYLNFHWNTRILSLLSGTEKLDKFYRTDLFTKNALMQITTWDYNQNRWLMDYASKQWNGMFKCYYWPRWQKFITELKMTIVNNYDRFNQTDYEEKVWKEIQFPFVHNQTYRLACLGG